MDNNTNNRNNNRNSRPGNPRDLSRAFSGSSGASRQLSARGSGQISGRGGRGPQHRGSIGHPYLPRLSQPLGQPNQAPEWPSAQRSPATDVNMNFNDATVHVSYNYFGPGSIDVENGSHFMRNMTVHGPVNVYRYFAPGSIEATSMQMRLPGLPLGHHQVGPQQSHPARPQLQPGPNFQPRRGGSDMPPPPVSAGRLPRDTSRAANPSKRERNDPASYQTRRRVEHSGTLGWRTYKKYKNCGNCKRSNHSAMDCLVANMDGFIYACPICNMKSHTIDGCDHREKVDMFEELVVNRGNKPPIHTTTDWYQLWVDKGCPPMALPYSVQFSRRLAAEDGEIMAMMGTFNPKTYDYKHPCDPQSETVWLPADPATVVGQIEEDRKFVVLPPQIPSPDAPPSAFQFRGEATEVDEKVVSQSLVPGFNMSSASRLTSGSRSGGRKSCPLDIGPQQEIPQLSAEEMAAAAAADPCHPANVADKCPNCLQEVGDCDPGARECRNVLACRACGSEMHFISDCPTRMSICRCDPVPQHVRDKCPMVCRQCWIAEGRPTDPGTSKAPLIRECQQHCGICDMDKSQAEHVLEGCQRLKCDFAHKSPSNNLSETHFRQDCRDRLCARWDCTEASSCYMYQHCRACGADEIRRYADGPTGHTCQWNTVWKLWELGPGRKILVAVLQCKRNPNDHEVLKPGKELVAVRQLAIRRQKDFKEWLYNGKGTEPDQTRPIIECQQCFDMAWPDGTYATQQPGAGPLPDTW